MKKEKAIKHLHIRIQPEQDRRWRQAAACKGQMFSRYVKSTLDTAANEDLANAAADQMGVEWII